MECNFNPNQIAMKKKIYKGIAYLFLVGLLSLNITSNLDLQLGGEKAEAYSQPIPCHSSGVFHLFYQYTKCSTCSMAHNHRGEDEGSCMR